MAPSTDEQRILWTWAKWTSPFPDNYFCRPGDKWNSALACQQQMPQIGLDASLVARYAVMKPVGHSSSRPPEGVLVTCIFFYDRVDSFNWISFASDLSDGLPFFQLSGQRVTDVGQQTFQLVGRRWKESSGESGNPPEFPPLTLHSTAEECRLDSPIVISHGQYLMKVSP